MSEKKSLQNIKDIKRLKWACRRGMLELDLLLGNFLEKGYRFLSADEQKLFVDLLHVEDQVLFCWLLGNETLIESHFIPLIQKIRSHARS